MQDSRARKSPATWLPDGPDTPWSSWLHGYAAIKRRREQGMRDIACAYCEERVIIHDAIEMEFESERVKLQSEALNEVAQRNIDNESRELRLLGDVFSIVADAGHIFRPIGNSDWGIDGEIEFKDQQGRATGQRVYLQLKAGDSYLRQRRDGVEIFQIKKDRYVEYWQSQRYPVMLVIRTSDGVIRWMNISEYLRRLKAEPKKGVRISQIEFRGEPFNQKALQVLCTGSTDR
jgi:hypothetical protein